MQVDWTELPPEIMVNAFEHIDAVRDLTRLAEVCKAWSTVSADTPWQGRLLRDFPHLKQVADLHGSPPVATSCLEIYKDQYIAERNAERIADARSGRRNGGRAALRAPLDAPPCSAYILVLDVFDKLTEDGPMQKIATMTSRLLPDNIHPDDDELLCSAGEHIDVSGRLEWLVPADKVRSVDSSGSVSGYVQSVGTAKWHDDDDDMRVRVLVTRTTDWKTFLLYESTFSDLTYMGWTENPDTGQREEDDEFVHGCEVLFPWTPRRAGSSSIRPLVSAFVSIGRDDDGKNSMREQEEQETDGTVDYKQPSSFAGVLIKRENPSGGGVCISHARMRRFLDEESMIATAA